MRRYIPGPYFKNVPVVSIRDLGGLYIPYAQMVGEVARYLEFKTKAFKRKPGLDCELEDKIQGLAEKIYREIDCYYEWMDWETVDGYRARSSQQYPYDTNAEVLLEFLLEEEASGSFVDEIQQEYSFDDPRKAIIAVQLILELDLLKTELKEQSSYKEKTLQDEGLIGSYLKSMGMLYSAWKHGIVKYELQSVVSEKAVVAAKRKGAWVRIAVISCYKKVLEKEPGIRKKDAAVIIAEELWQDAAIVKKAKKAGILSEDELRETKIKNIIYRLKL